MSTETKTIDISAVVGQCFLSQDFGIIFNNNNSVATNPHIQDYLASEGVEAMLDDANTSFYVSAQGFAHFMHMVYSHVPDGKKLRVEFDGLYPFETTDTGSGKLTKFVAQLVTISEVEE